MSYQFTSKFYWVLLLILFTLIACDRQPKGKPAPVGDHAVLEQLATAYRTVAEDYPVQLASMRPAGKKEFVQRVFATAGYDYGATLLSFAKRGADFTSQDQRDLAELLFLPHRGLEKSEQEKLYSQEEWQAVRSIQADLN